MSRSAARWVIAVVPDYFIGYINIWIGYGKSNTMSKVVKTFSMVNIFINIAITMSIFHSLPIMATSIAVLNYFTFPFGKEKIFNALWNLFIFQHSLFITPCCMKCQAGITGGVPFLP